MESLLGEMRALALRQAKADPIEARALERRLGEYGREAKALGLKAVKPLEGVLARKSESFKLRLYAAAFLGAIGDPAAFRSLKERLDDASEEPGLRSAALQALGSLRLDPPAKRRLLEAAAYAPQAPELVLREALLALSALGAEDAGAMATLAKRHGPAPSGTERESAAFAVRALAASPRSAERELFGLLGYFKKGSELRRETVAALRARKPRPEALLPVERTAMRALIFEEKGAVAAEAMRLSADVRDLDAVPALVQSLTLHDPPILAEAAEALARIGDPGAARALKALAAGIHADERFAPRPGAEDPRPYAARIQRAAAVFGPLESRAAPAEPEISAPSGKAPEAAPPPPPAREPFRYEGWPGSGEPKPAFGPLTASFVLRAAPASGAPEAARAAVTPGRSIPIEDSVVLTREPGVLRARRRLKVELRDLGPERPLTRADYAGAAPRVTLSLDEGGAFEVLALRPEGACFLRLAGRVYEGECLTGDSEKLFELALEPKTEWWIKTSLLGKSGWFPASDESVDFLAR